MTIQNRPEPARPYVIGLTGNIATGKSTVAAMLASLGARVLDADKLAHWVMRPGTDVYRGVVARFGTHILAPGGEINRARLGSIVFADPEALADLDALVHPAVVQESVRWIAELPGEVLAIEAIKLLEANMDRFCDAVWVVTTSRAQQVERLIATRGLDRESAEVRIAAQPASETSTARAEVIIDNSGALAQTWQQVLRAWNAIPGIIAVCDDMPWPAAGPED